MKIRILSHRYHAGSHHVRIRNIEAPYEAVTVTISQRDLSYGLDKIEIGDIFEIDKINSRNISMAFQIREMHKML